MIINLFYIIHIIRFKNIYNCLNFLFMVSSYIYYLLMRIIYQLVNNYKKLFWIIFLFLIFIDLYFDIMPFLINHIKKIHKMISYINIKL